MDIATLQELLRDQAKAFEKESIIHSIIISHAYLEGYLEQRLKIHLAGSQERELPAKSFYYKIELAYRIGLISARFRDDLHSIRRIRNNFVHFEWQKNERKISVDWDMVKKLTIDIRKTFAGFLRKFADIRIDYPEGILGDILMIMVAMECEIIIPTNKFPAKIQEAQEEILYEYDLDNGIEKPD